VITRLLLGLAAAGLVSGCSTLPKFDVSPAGVEEHIGPTVDQVMTHIQCEIRSLVEDRAVEFNELRLNHYIVKATLTLDVTDVQTFSPSISTVEPYLRAGTSRVVTLGGQLQGTQHRNMNLEFTLDLDPVHKIDGELTKKCVDVASGKDGLQGDLGLRDLVLSGVKAKKGVFYLPPSAYDKDGKEVPLAGAAPSFGTTVDFTILRSVGGGPAWTLTYFKGPASGNLLNVSKSRKDTLALAFSSAGPRGKVTVSGKSIESQSVRPDAPAGQSNVEQAIRNAQDNLTRMLLQRLLPQ
jgi:hypothetical protein